MYSIAICDDNAEEGKYICTLTKQIFAERNVEAAVSTFLSPEDLLADIKRDGNQYDLFLLDIIMEDTDGIELAKALREMGSRAMLIYITVSRDYALDGYKVQANDYLVKPIDREALESSIERILTRHDTILVRSEGIMKTVMVSDIQYVEAFGNYAVLKMGKQGLQTQIRMTLMEMEQKLGNERLARCHKGYLVNLDWIMEIQKNQILLRNGVTVPLGRKYRETLQEDMVQYVEKAIPR